MKKFIVRCLATLFTIVLLAGLVGCGSESQTNHESSKNTLNQSGSAIAGLPQGFPAEIPIYTGAEVIEADNFNGNNYTILYSVNADYDKIVDLYTDAFDLDGSGTGDDGTFYEGLDFGDVFIKGLTIEDSGDAVNVYLTIQDNRQDTDLEGYSESEESEETIGVEAGSDVMTYDAAEEVSLDKNYPQDVVPLPEGAKVISCSMVSGTRSGFVDLILPGNDFNAAVNFYTDELGLTPKNSTTPVQEAASFKGEISGIKVVILISHLMGGGHDTLVQITTN